LLTASQGAESLPTGRTNDGQQPKWLVVVPLFLGSMTCTLSNNIVNVPLHSILSDLDVPLSRGALIVIAFGLTTAVMMPIAGWLADRLGRRRIYLWAVSTVGVASVGASLAPNLDVLVMFRVLQALSAASTLPAAMGILTELYGVENRGRALGIWASANGLGQALGPPVGGLIAAVLSWRWIFSPTIFLSVISWSLAMAVVPRDHGHGTRLEWRGATTLTVGAGLLIASASVIPQVGVGSPLVVVLAALGLSVLTLFVRLMRSSAAPFVDPSLFREASYVRSTLAVFAQMFCLGVMVLGVPLFLTRTMHRSTTTTGIIVFALPAAMTAFAPLAGRAAEGIRMWRVLRTGMAILVAAQLLLAAELAWWPESDLAIAGALIVGGAGVAFVQAPAATGATRSALGRAGTGLGLFNLVRFAGSALGSACVAIALSGANHYGVLFAASAVAVGGGLACTWVRPERPTALAAALS
jgi:MFS family permease